MEAQDPLDDITRPELLVELMGYINEAKNMPLSELCKRGDYSQPGARGLQTKSEYLANDIMGLLVSQTWIDGESEPILDDMLGVVSQLDMSVDKPKDWQRLFEIAQEL